MTFLCWLTDSQNEGCGREISGKSIRTPAQAAEAYLQRFTIHADHLDQDRVEVSVRDAKGRLFVVSVLVCISCTFQGEYTVCLETQPEPPEKRCQ
jgi:hypothetical protein